MMQLRGTVSTDDSGESPSLSVVVSHRDKPIDTLRGPSCAYRRRGTPISGEVEGSLIGHLVLFERLSLSLKKEPLCADELKSLR